MNSHWAAIPLPVSVVDDAVDQELAHLFEPNHTPEFWLRVGRVLPEYERRRSWLAERSGRYVVL